IKMDHDGVTTLTPSGKASADKIYERPLLLSSWLEQLGVDAKEAAENACRLEQVISSESIEAIKRNTHLMENKLKYGEKAYSVSEKPLRKVLTGSVLYVTAFPISLQVCFLCRICFLTLFFFLCHFFFNLLDLLCDPFFNAVHNLIGSRQFLLGFIEDSHILGNLILDL